ncbi:hypothetical protein ABZ912_45840 [Nonomuraea angiospora]|uniref:hypothetical protein n=1 Tax=Nonomuraea angiospora TaxID=46172 RepID=UPI0034066727
MSSSAPKQLDPAGPRRGPAGRLAGSGGGLPGRPVAGREGAGRLPWMLVVPALVGLAFRARQDGPAFVAFPPAAETHAYPA